MECVIVQDLFLNETASYAHIFLPGCSFLEKDGTFTNAERRIGRVRKVMSPKNGLGDWEITVKLAQAMGVPMNYAHPSEIMDEIAATTPSFAGVSFAKLDELGSIQWPCNEKAPEGTPIMHIGDFVRGEGKFVITEYLLTMWRPRRAEPRMSPGTRKTVWKSIRTTPNNAASMMAIGLSSQAALGRRPCGRSSPIVSRLVSFTRHSTIRPRKPMS
jgi:predicted molibdopterin-dependent oxidoreductase YjgC